MSAWICSVHTRGLTFMQQLGCNLDPDSTDPSSSGIRVNQAVNYNWEGANSAQS